MFLTLPILTTMLSVGEKQSRDGKTAGIILLLSMWEYVGVKRILLLCQQTVCATHWQNLPTSLLCFFFFFLLLLPPTHVCPGSPVNPWLPRVTVWAAMHSPGGEAAQWPALLLQAGEWDEEAEVPLWAQCNQTSQQRWGFLFFGSLWCAFK